jgi:aspartate aminotransferase-like enzyme
MRAKGFELAQGYGALKDTTYRIGNMGYIPDLSINQMLDALKEVYKELSP